MWLGGSCNQVIARYVFDDSSGTTATDVSGHDRNGALVNGASLVAGHRGNAVQIAGGTQQVSLPTGIVQSCNDLTIATWVKLADNPSWGRIFDFGSSMGTNMFLTPAAGGAILRFAIRNSWGAEQRISYPYTFPLNTWKHVAVVLNGNTGTLYLDGVQVAQNTNVTLNPSNLGSTVNNWLGHSQYAADPNLNGLLDDFRIYCRAFSAAEIAEIAQ
jgi:hypothetical protein